MLRRTPTAVTVNSKSSHQSRHLPTDGRDTGSPRLLACANKRVRFPFFGNRFHCVAQAGLKILAQLTLPAPQIVGTTVTCHHTWPTFSLKPQVLSAISLCALSWVGVPVLRAERADRSHLCGIPEGDCVIQPREGKCRQWTGKRITTLGQTRPTPVHLLGGGLLKYPTPK